LLNYIIRESRNNIFYIKYISNCLFSRIFVHNLYILKYAKNYRTIAQSRKFVPSATDNISFVHIT